MAISPEKVHQDIESLRDVLLSGTTYIQAHLLKIEHKIKDMTQALKLCEEKIKEIYND